MTRRTPTQDRAQVTVQAILDATALLLVEEGYARTSTNRIAKRAGVSVGSLYHYFQDKDAVLHALVEQVIDRKTAVLLEQLAGTRERDLEEGVRDLIRAMLAAQRIDTRLSHVLLTECPRESRQALHHRWQQRMVELITARMLLDPDNIRPRNVGLGAYVLVHAVFGVVEDALTHRPELVEGDALATELTELVVRYLRPEAG